MTRFILEMDHLSGADLHTNWACNNSSRDNSSVYRYLVWTDDPSVCPHLHAQANYQTNYRCLPN